MINPRLLAIENYSYDLPDERIAKYPLSQRNQSKLLVYRGGEIKESRFECLPDQIPAGALVVFNNTKVIQARLHFRKETGALIEVFCLEPHAPRDYAQNFAAEESCVWSCLVGNSKKWKTGSLRMPVVVGGQELDLCCERYTDPEDSVHSSDSQLIRFYWEASGVRFADILDAVGELPIPPYLSRHTEEKDKETYQTVYAHEKGSVAAPTAGLHFTETELSALRAKNVGLKEITLHVGAGTFKPVKSRLIDGHEMHHEFISVPREVIVSLIHQLEKPQNENDSSLIISVGTTSVRTLESLYYIGSKIAQGEVSAADDIVVSQWDPYERQWTLSTTEALRHIVDYLDRIGATTLTASTQILIAPGFPFRIVGAMVTNFHMPQSTLLLLVSAFVDGIDASTGLVQTDDEKLLLGEVWHRIYDYALSHDFRFLSYGDSSILFRR